jgi:ribosomal protein S18 acetylase RimI-like enzyme
MAAPYSLRQATDEDFQFMRDTKLESMEPYVRAVWGWDQKQQEERFKNTFDPPSCQIVTVGGADAGIVSVIDQEDVQFLAGIYLARSFRRIGLGSAIIADLIERAAARGQAVTLRVLKVNSARRLYERLGFELTGETETHYMMRADGLPRIGRSI